MPVAQLAEAPLKISLKRPAINTSKSNKNYKYHQEAGKNTI
jgi:hypothetical protein